MLDVLDLFKTENFDVDNFKPSDTDNDHLNFIYSEIRMYVDKNIDFFTTESEESQKTRTRSELYFELNSALASTTDYVNVLWCGIVERLSHFDKDGTTNWSEAPAEGIFSIIDHIIEFKPSLTVEKMIQLCRIVREGPPSGSMAASILTKAAFTHWPAGIHRDRGVFITQDYNYRLRTTSSTVKKQTKDK